MIVIGDYVYCKRSYCLYEGEEYHYGKVVHACEDKFEVEFIGHHHELRTVARHTLEAIKISKEEYEEILLRWRALRSLE